MSKEIQKDVITTGDKVEFFDGKATQTGVFIRKTGQFYIVQSDGDGTLWIHRNCKLIPKIKRYKNIYSTMQELNDRKYHIDTGSPGFMVGDDDFMYSFELFDKCGEICKDIHIPDWLLEEE